MKRKLKRQQLDCLPARRLERALHLLRQIRQSGQKVVVAVIADDDRFWAAVDLQLADILLPGTKIRSATGNMVAVFPVAAHRPNYSGGAV